MFWADQIGLKKIYDVLVKYHDQTGDSFWKPAKLLKELAESGKTFASL
jgi:3-hydroxyacyl-CoA dehydrogenase